MKRVISIIIPTWNNEQYLNPCLSSIYKTGLIESGYADVIVVNNGKQRIKEQWGHLPGLKVIDCPENLGWEGGLKEGLKHTDAPFLVFQNDDTFIPTTNYNFYERLLLLFNDDNVAAVSPCTTTAAGVQSIYHPLTPLNASEARWVIFFTVMVRRSHLEAVGGIDDTLPGGDDFDLSIRFNEAGKKVMIQPSAFIIHHGFKTGVRVKGDSNVDGGWNSVQMSERTNIALIRKHGFKTYLKTVTEQLIPYNPEPIIDLETEMIKTLIAPEDSILEVACGYKKIRPDAIGMDQIPKGELIPIFHGPKLPSMADVVGDVMKPLPFDDEKFSVIIARHILEHCVDLVETVTNWMRVLKPGGKLIIAVPDQDIVNGIPLDPTHFHAFTQDSLRKLMESFGMTQSFSEKTGNGLSFVSSFEKCVGASCPSSWTATSGEEITCSE